MDEASRTPEDLLAYLRVYLSEAHRHHPDQGCLLAAPNGEIAREEAVRPLATGHFAATLERMQRLLPCWKGWPSAPICRYWKLLTSCLR